VPERKRVQLMGLSFDPESMDSAVARCLQWCAGGRASHTVITANAGVLCMMRRDPELRQACQSGDLILADGMSVVWALRLARTPVAERVTGVDLMSRLLQVGASRNLRVFFLGAREEVVRALADSCVSKYPGLVVAGYRNGYFSAADHPAVVEQIRESRPDMVFVGMPSPLKEVFLERHRARLEAPILIGVGGSFDVLAGYVERAPPWLRSVGMEWSWRLMMEPRKMWKRYLTTNTEFLWTAGREALARRLGVSSS
jgi:N-acetylglucosaminyldiphosphoundecaprenol N-acetyl-beta-D-mannosaminyltransferase